jgi:hypothetical protein
MGIDIYAEWDGMTKEEHSAQITGFSSVHGHVGYLREAYHGEPYATRMLVPEAFETPDGARIPAATLRARLPETLKTARVRMRVLYKQNPDGANGAAELKSFENFVALCEAKEAECGTACRIKTSF